MRIQPKVTRALAAPVVVTVACTPVPPLAEVEAHPNLGTALATAAPATAASASSFVDQTNFHGFVARDAEGRCWLTPTVTCEAGEPCAPEPSRLVPCPADAAELDADELGYNGVIKRHGKCYRMSYSRVGELCCTNPPPPPPVDCPLPKQSAPP
ncbi:MAG: hypothetical protein U0271_39885 [Polyangiaceae bacterium]